MKNTIRITIFLAIIACLSGLSLGVVNSFTAPIIEKNAKEAEKKNLETIFPGGNFITLDYADEDGVILGVYEVANEGYIFKATAKGYNSSNPIVTLIGMDLDGTIINVIALSQQETSGIGTKCFDETNVKELYIGKKVNDSVDGISGATFTSNAMKTMIQKAQAAFSEVQ